MMGVLSIVGSPSSSGADDESSTATVLADVRKTLEAQRDALESLRVRYRYSIRLVGAVADVKQYLGLAALGDETCVYALKGGKRYSSFSRTDNLNDRAASIPAVGESEDPNQPATMSVLANSISAYNGSDLRQRQSGGADFAIMSLDPKSSDARYFWTNYLGLVSRVPPDIANPNLSRSELRLLDSLVEGRCTLRDHPEQVGEASCVVADWPGAQPAVLWLDPKRGYAIVKRETYYEGSALLVWRVSVADWIPGRDGAWWPRKATAEYFAGPDAPDRLHNVPLVAYDYDVLELDLNDVPDRFFEMEFPEGARVIDFADGADDPATGQRIGKSKFVDHSGKLIEGHPDRPPDPRPDEAAPQPPARAGRKTVVIAINAIVVVAIALYVVWRRGRR